MANGGIIGPVVTPPNVQTQSAPGVWTLQEAQEYIRQGLWPRRYDPLYNYTTLLLSGNGANNATNNSFLDSSSNNFTVTRNGNTTQGTFSPFSQTGWGNYFDGTGDYLSVADNSVLRLGTSNFTIECWVNRAANGTAHSILAKGGASTGWLLEVTSGNVLQFTHTTTTITTSLPVYAGNWVHVAAVREGTGSNQFKLYINGTLAQTATMATDFTQTDTLYIGANRSAATTMNGYISNVRIVNGTALYTAQFTPSTTPLTTTSQGATAAQVELLTCQSNRFLDNSGNGFTVTPAGNSAVVAFSPFNATRPWDPLTYGGGGYFDGSGDYLGLPTSQQIVSATGDLTIECFVYPTSLSSDIPVYTQTNGGASSGRLNLAIFTSGALYFQIGGSSYTGTSGTVKSNQWNFISATRTGSSVSFYVNGASAGSGTVAGTIDTGSSIVAINRGADGTVNPIPIYYGSFRISNSVRSNLTNIPTAPYTSDTNTSLLLNFTNIGITDATSKNALETVGDAKISTAQSKFGGSSIVFDGTGDFLSVVSTSLLGYGTGNFTIEFWTYVTSTSNTPYFFDCRTTATANEAVPALYINGGNYEYYVSGAARITGGAVPTNQWVHVALVRNSGTTTLYSNGTSTGTYSDSTSYISCPMVIGQRKDTTSQSLNGYIQEFRVTKGVARYTENFAVPDSAFATLGNTPPSVDPYFDYTTLLLPGSGSNNATNSSFLDSSANNFTITRNGNTTQGTFSPFSQTGWGNYFDGTGDYLSTPNVAGLRLGAGDFCLEAWIYPTRLTNTYEQAIAGTHGYVTGSDKGYEMYLNASGYPAFFIGNTSGATQISLISSTLVTANAWNHIAAVRSGSSTNNVKLYLNGVQVAQGTTTYDDTWTGADFNIGTTRADNLTPSVGNSGTSLQGYISNLRLVKGSPVYTAAFTPPTSPLTAISGTSLLTCQSNRFIDNSGNSLTITPNGNTSVVAFSPFNPSASWSAATYGGSGYFDGSGDSLTLTGVNLSSGNWTIECFVYIQSFATTLPHIFNIGTDGNNRFALYRNSATSKFNFVTVNSGVYVSAESTTAPTVGQWYHVAVVSNSGTRTLYVNGAAEATSTTAINNGTSYSIGNLQFTPGASDPLTGYISNFRVVTSAVYTGNFTPPSLAPLTTAGSTSAASYPSTTNVNTSFASSATSLLLNFTNAGITDATAKNDLETVGDAKISTAQSVWTAYGASMYFDGTGDYLLSQASNDLYAFGSGDFTIELWLRLNNVSGQKNIYDPNPTSTVGLYPNIYILNTTLYYFTNGSNRITAGTALSADTWYHIAVARSGTSTKMFLNGTQEGSTYTDSNVYINGGAGRPVIGGSGYTLGSNILNGYIQDLRITKGIARYTSNFQPPSAPLALR